MEINTPKNTSTHLTRPSLKTCVILKKAVLGIKGLCREGLMCPHDKKKGKANQAVNFKSKRKEKGGGMAQGKS